MSNRRSPIQVLTRLYLAALKGPPALTPYHSAIRLFKSLVKEPKHLTVAWLRPRGGASDNLTHWLWLNGTILCWEHGGGNAIDTTAWYRSCYTISLSVWFIKNNSGDDGLKEGAASKGSLPSQLIDSNNWKLIQWRFGCVESAASELLGRKVQWRVSGVYILRYSHIFIFIKNFHF